MAKTMTNIFSLVQCFRNCIPNSSLFTGTALSASVVNKKTEIRPYYLRPQAGIVLSLSTFFSAHKWAGIETQILFLPIRKWRLVTPSGGFWHSAWISNCTVSYIIYNSLSLALLVSCMPLYLSTPLQLCTFLLPVSSGTLLMIKACSFKPLKPLLLIYSILVPKHPSISPFFPPTQFSWRSFHQGQLASPPLPSLNWAEGSP